MPVNVRDTFSTEALSALRYCSVKRFNQSFLTKESNVQKSFLELQREKNPQENQSVTNNEFEEFSL